MQFSTSFALTALSVFAAVQQSVAVCAGGQMAVGREQLSQMEGENWVQFYSGFLMANNCGLIAQNGLTGDSNQLCDGGYSGGAAVYCSGGKPTQAKDTQGHMWNCSPTSDTSCNENVGIGGFQVLACCSRA